MPGAGGHALQPVASPFDILAIGGAVLARGLGAQAAAGEVVSEVSSEVASEAFGLPIGVGAPKVARVGTAKAGVSEIPVKDLIPTHPVPRPQVPTGHIDDLARGIADNGFQLDKAIPVIRTPDGRLILGGGNHRLAAMKQLKQETIPARVVDWFSLSEGARNFYRTRFPDVFGGL